MNTHRGTTPAHEPAISIGSVSAVISAGLALAVVLGLDLPAGFEAALLAFVAAAGPVIAAIITRARVTPTVDVVERRNGGDVLAGKGHESIAEGEKIRDVRA